MRGCGYCTSRRSLVPVRFCMSAIRSSFRISSARRPPTSRSTSPLSPSLTARWGWEPLERCRNESARRWCTARSEAKHAKMVQDMLHYQKFVAGFDEHSTQRAAEHFCRRGFHGREISYPGVGELSKLIETTWLGVLIGWAQEVERMAAGCRCFL